MKIANIIGKIMMVLFGLSSIRWITEMLGLFGQRFWADDLPTVAGNIALFVVGIIITVSTQKHIKKK